MSGEMENWLDVR